MTMSTTHTAGKRERLEARITPKQKELFERAAVVSGRSLTDFVISTVEAAATEAIRTHQIMELTARSTEAFIAAAQNPPGPNEQLRAATQRYRELIGEW